MPVCKRTNAEAQALKKGFRIVPDLRCWLKYQTKTLKIVQVSNTGFMYFFNIYFNAFSRKLLSEETCSAFRLYMFPGNWTHNLLRC